MKNDRLCETEDEALCRREVNRLSMKNVRLLESDEMVEMRKEANKVHMRAK